MFTACRAAQEVSRVQTTGASGGVAPRTNRSPAGLAFELMNGLAGIPAHELRVPIDAVDQPSCLSRAVNAEYRCISGVTEMPCRTIDPATTTSVTSASVRPAGAGTP